MLLLNQQEAALSQGRPRDAASCSIRIEFLQRRRAVYSTAFVHSPTSASVQMLKLHTVRWYAIAENHATGPVNATMIVNMWLFYIFTALKEMLQRLVTTTFT